jgi:hypothetical protein
MATATGDSLQEYSAIPPLTGVVEAPFSHRE